MPKLSKKEARYEPQAKGSDECSDCKHYRAPRQCERVEGMVNAGGWCKLFSPVSRMAHVMKGGK